MKLLSAQVVVLLSLLSAVSGRTNFTIVNSCLVPIDTMLNDKHFVGVLNPGQSVPYSAEHTILNFGANNGIGSGTFYNVGAFLNYLWTPQDMVFATIMEGINIPFGLTGVSIESSSGLKLVCPLACNTEKFVPTGGHITIKYCGI